MQRIHFAKIALSCGAVAAAAIAKPLDLQPGARAFGMGGAFAAIADDGTATYWNPAGLSQLGGLTLSETNWMFQDVAGLNVNYFTGAVPISHVGTVAGGWLMQYANLEQGEGSLQSESSWYEHAFSLAAGRELWEKLWIFEHTSLGFSLDRYVLNSGDLNGAGTGFELGFLTQFPHGIRLGLVAHSLGADMMGDKIDPEFRMGLGYIWQRGTRHKVVADFDLSTKEEVEYEKDVDGVDRNYKGAFGAEYTFRQDEWAVSARAGVNSGVINSRDMTAFAAGVGVEFRGINLEYGHLFNANQDVSLGNSLRVTLQMRLDPLIKTPAASAPVKAQAGTSDATPAAADMDLPMDGKN